MQYAVREFNEQRIKKFHQKEMPISARLLDLQSEVGELSKEVLKSTKYGVEPFVMSENFEMEFGDVLYTLLSLANETNLNAEIALGKVIKKYESRLINNNNMGSHS